MLHYFSIVLTQIYKEERKNSRHSFIAKIGKVQTEGGTTSLWRAKGLGDTERRGLWESREEGGRGDIFI